MEQALEWIQCKGCGRRHRWSVELAGRVVECSCGYAVEMPEGPDGDAGFDASDTIIEDVDSPTASAPDLSEMGLDDLTADMLSASSRNLIGASARRAEVRMVWATVFLLLGIAVLIHAVFVQWREYIIAASILMPIALVMFFKCKSTWQRGRSFMRSLRETLERFDPEDD